MVFFDHAFHRVVSNNPLASGRAQFIPVGLFHFDQPSPGIHKCIGILWGHNDPGLADDLRRVADIGDHAGHPAGHRFPDHIWESITPGGSQRGDIQAGCDGGNILALGTFLGESSENRNMTFKVDCVDEDGLKKAIEPYIERIIDIRW